MWPAAEFSQNGGSGEQGNAGGRWGEAEQGGLERAAPLTGTTYRVVLAAWLDWRCSPHQPSMSWAGMNLPYGTFCLPSGKQHRSAQGALVRANILWVASVDYTL